jgi:hypothetical protein
MHGAKVKIKYVEMFNDSSQFIAKLDFSINILVYKSWSENK